jgi:hypothetical protein
MGPEAVLALAIVSVATALIGYRAAGRPEATSRRDSIRSILLCSGSASVLALVMTFLTKEGNACGTTLAVVIWVQLSAFAGEEVARLRKRQLS